MTKKILITGGAGFLGRAILRQAKAENWDADISIMSRDEAKLVRVRGVYPQARLIKADVTADIETLTRIFAGHDVVIHAAANKLVDIGEVTAFETVRNNITGANNVAKAAINAGIKQVVGISSDKAVQPVNTYGMTKALLERLFQEADTISDTEFTCARYGNVIGSTISIVLYFKQQLKEHGYIQVTNPNMTRFYMPVVQSIDLINYCLQKAQRGSVVIPYMKGMSVANVANLVLNRPMDEPVFGYEEKIKIVGERPGEKLHESLLHDQESVRVLNLEQTQDPNYYELRPVTEKHRMETFNISSANPPGGWMEFSEMERWIEDATHV